MNVQAALKGQYHAALAMLKQTIERCPEELWLRDGQREAAGTGATPGAHPGAHPGAGVAFWRVAYHTLFFTHLYLQPNVDAFVPWEHHRDEHQSLGPPPWAPGRAPKIGEPYTKAQVLEYWRECDALVDTMVDRLDLAAPTCGFPWYQIPKLDHQLNNIRHIQHHAALLSGRLRAAGVAGVEWVGFG